MLEYIWIYLHIFDICLYIYISIYNCGPISRVQGSKAAFPPKSPQRKKSLFLVSSFGTVFWVLPKAPDESFRVPFGGFRNVFFCSRSRTVCGMWKSRLLECFLERRANVLYCKNMQTVQYILQKSKVRVHCFLFFYLRPREVHFGGSKAYTWPSN